MFSLVILNFRKSLEIWECFEVRLLLLIYGRGEVETLRQFKDLIQNFVHDIKFCRWTMEDIWWFETLWRMREMTSQMRKMIDTWCLPQARVQAWIQVLGHVLNIIVVLMNTLIYIWISIQNFYLYTSTIWRLCHVLDKQPKFDQ